MKAIGPTTSDELHSQSISTLKMHENVLSPTTHTKIFKLK